MTVALFTETGPRCDRHMGFVDQLQREFEAPHLAQLFGDRGPGKHGGFRTRHGPARARETFHQHVPPCAIGLAEFVDTVLRAVERSRRSNLDRRIGTIIQIGFHTGQRSDELFVAGHEADPPAGHGIGFRHGREFDRDVLRPVHLQDRGGRLVEIDFIVGQVRQYDQIVLAGELHRFLVEIEVTDFSRRIGREAQHHRCRRGHAIAHGLAEIRKVLFRGVGRHAANGCSGDDEAEGMQRVGRVRRQDDIARCGYGLGEVCKPFLRTECHDDFAVHVQRYVKPALVVIRHSPAQALDPARRGIAVHIRPPRRLAQLVDDVCRCRHVGIAHAQVDNVRALRTQGRLGAVHLLEDVRRKSANLVEICIHLLAALRPLVTRGTSKADRMAAISSSVRNSEVASRPANPRRTVSLRSSISAAIFAGSTARASAANMARSSSPRDFDVSSVCPGVCPSAITGTSMISG